MLTMLSQFINADNPLKYELAIKMLCSKTCDTHAIFLNSESAIKEKSGSKSPPLLISYVEGRFVVKYIFNKEIAKKAGINIGDILLKVNQIDANKLCSDNLKYISGSNERAKLRNFALNDLIVTNYSSIDLTIEREGKVINLNIDCEIEGYKNIDSDWESDSCFQWVAPNILRIFPSKVKTLTVEEIAEKAKSAKGIIIDLRCYPSFYLVDTIGDFLLSEPRKFVKFSKPIFDKPGTFYLDSPLYVGIKNPAYYSGKVVILVNDSTQSSAEFHAMAFSTAKRAMIIGSQTAGSDGDITNIVLPGAKYTMISGLGVYYPDGRTTQRIGVKLDEVVEPSLKGIKDGRDEVLDRAIKIINN